MLFPALLPSLTDPGTRVARNEERPEGSRPLHLDVTEPSPEIWTVDVSAAGHPDRLEANVGDTALVIELAASEGTTPDRGPFHLAAPWNPQPG